MMREMVRIADIDVVAPNFKRRLSGVTSAVVQLVPRQAEHVGIATLGPGLPDHLPKITWWQTPALLKRPTWHRFRIWHAKRNVEMLVGVVLRTVLRAPLKIVFTSAAQRHHSWFTRFLIARMDSVIATSERSGRFLKAPYTVVSHGVDCEGFCPSDEREASNAGAELPGGFAIGCFGRIRHQKGTDLFIEAMIRLLPEYPDWSAVVTGRVTPQHREYYEQLLHRVRQSGLERRILFQGEVPDVGPWYRRLLLYVAPSRNEGFGLTPLEAMASGTAVVASDAGAYPEIVVEGVTGAVVPAGDRDTLTEAIRRYLANPGVARAHGHNAREHVRRKCSLDNEVRSINSVYLRLWEGASVGRQTRRRSSR